MDIPYFAEAQVRSTLSRRHAFAAVESVFVALDEGAARNFPVVREKLPGGPIFGIKSGIDLRLGALGLKAGGYWPGNEASGRANHQSTILLFDPASGLPIALVAANLVTALRTAAASAVSIKHLARKDSRTLGLVGAGHQMPFQLEAALDILPFDRVLNWNRTAGRGERLRTIAHAANAKFEELPLPAVCEAADVLITVTSSAGPLVRAEWLKPGTHVAAMGTDTAGKQEFDAGAIAGARVFTDDVAQAIVIGECQHAVRERRLSPENIVPLGRVIRRAGGERTDPAEVTIFDGTGLALQDLALAAQLI
jgi:ornithine cyclodeaminase